MREQVFVGGRQTVEREVQEEDWERYIGGHDDHYLAPFGYSEIYVGGTDLFMQEKG